MNRYGAKYGLSKTRDSLAGIRGRTRLTWWSLVLESLLQAYWSLFSLVLSVYAFVAFNGLKLLPIMAGQVVLGLAVVVGLWLLYRGFRRFSLPTRATALARMDADLPNHPIAALQDESAIGINDSLTRELWELHQSRMEVEAEAARAAAPDPQLYRQDRAGLRLAAIIAVVAALFFAPRAELSTFVDAVTGAQAVAPPSVAIEAWASPPTYTGMPAIYLSEIDNGETLELPVNTIITLRTYGEGAFEMGETVSGQNTVLPEAAPDVSVRDVSFTVRHSGALGLRNGKDILGDWFVTMVPDEPPVLEVPDGVEKDSSGAMELTYRALDDYGIESATITIRPDLSLVDRVFGLTPDPEVPEAITRDLPLPFSNDRTDVKETFFGDFSENIWVGLPVVVTLEVTDAAGQTATLVLEPDNLPGRSFFDPLASAIVEQRRDLMWSPENDLRVSQVMRAISYRPEDDLFPNASAYLLTRTAIRRMGYAMEAGLGDEMRNELAALFWHIAVLIEDGDLSGAEARLRRAQERLSQALEDGATQEEIAGLMDELRDATDDYMQELAEQGQQDPSQQQAQNQQQDTITADQLQQMLDRIQELSENGQTEEAQQLLEQLQEFMENMEVTQAPGQSGRQTQDQQDLQNSLEEQQELSDEAFQQLQEQFDQREQGQEPGEEQGQGLAERQEALREYLERLQQQQNGEESADALEQAERSMGNARDRLEDGDYSGALDEQADALEHLRQGLRDLDERNQADLSGQDGQVDRESNERDPLGRPLGSQGRVDNGDTAVPDQNAPERARELMEEIRRRSGEQGRPVEELDYLRRLLDRF